MENYMPPDPTYGSLSPSAADPDKVPVTAGLPYPELYVKKWNSDWSKLLFSDGTEEFNAICQYLWGSWQLEPFFPHIADTLKRMAQVEMHHLDILSRLTVMSGNRPFCGDAVTFHPFWNDGSTERNQPDVNQILRLSLADEEKAMEAYGTQAAFIDDHSLSAILLRIALDEQVHIKILKRFLSKGR